MSAMAVSAGSQPAVDLFCDEPHCMRAIRKFVDTFHEARLSARLSGWMADSNGTDMCPVHS